MPANGGDRENGGAPGTRGGEGSFLHLHRFSSAGRGERTKLKGGVVKKKTEPQSAEDVPIFPKEVITY